LTVPSLMKSFLPISILRCPAATSLIISISLGVSTWAASGGYEPVAETLFNDVNVDGYFLEFDSERAGGFEPLRHVPKGKKIVLGLVTTKTPQMEAMDVLKRRIDEAAKYVDPGFLCVSPQCGFSSTVHGNEIALESQAAKLRLVIETAREVWG